jgi:predicted nucleotidyltransferase
MKLDEELESIVTRIKTLLNDDIDFIVLFGSAATGHTQPLSDLDIGVKVSVEEAKCNEIFSNLLSLFDLSRNPRVDITLLNDGKMLFARNDDVWQVFVEYVLIRYPDWNYYIENYLKQSIGA